MAVIATAQTGRSIPYWESFENGIGGWTVIDGDGDGYNWRVVDFSSIPPMFASLGYYAHEGMHVLYSESTDDSIPLSVSNWVVSPILEMPDNIPDSLKLSWWVKSLQPSMGSDRYEVRIAEVYDTMVDTTLFDVVLYDETVNYNTYQQRSVSLAGYEGMLVRLAFHHFSSQGSSLQLDDISVGNDSLPMVSIQGPTFVDVNDTVLFTATLLSGSTTGLTFSWISNSADFIESYNGDTTRMSWSNGGLFTVGVAVTNMFGSDTSWLEVTVNDCSIIDTLPFYEDFNNSSATRICWKMLDADGNGTAWTYANGWAESNSVTFFGLVPEADNWLISPPLMLGDEYRQLSWQVRPGNELLPAEHYTVYISTSADVFDTSSYTALFSETLTATTEWQTRYLSLAEYYGETVRIAFRHHQTNDQESLQLTAMTVEAAGAPFVTLHAPNSAIVGDSVRFLLDTFSVSPIWDITWRIETDTSGTFQTIVQTNTQPFTFAWPNGTDAGYYWVYVDVTNDEGTTSDSAQIYLHVCEVIDSLPYYHTFGHDEDCWRIGTGWYLGDSIMVDGVETAAAISFSHDEFGHNLHADNRIATPYIHIPDDSYELRYIVTEATSLYGDYSFDCYSLIIRHSGITDTLIQGAVATGDLQKHRLYLGNYAYEDIQIEFYHHDSPSGYAIQLAEVQVVAVGEPEVSISAPSRARSGEWVTLAANVVSSENLSYQWTLVGAIPAMDTTSTVVAQWNMSGTYQIILTVTSPLYGNYADTTHITIIDCSGIDELPYTEHFDMDMSCWRSHDLDGDGYGWEMVASGDLVDMMFAPALSWNHQGNALVSWSTRPQGNLLSFILSGSGDSLSANNLLLSPSVTLPDTGDWRFSFHVASAATCLESLFENVNDHLDSFEVLITTNITDFSIDDSTLYDNFIVLMPMQVADSGGYGTYSISLEDYLGQNVRLALRHRSSGQVGLLFDEVSIYQYEPPVYMVTVVSADATMGTVSGGGQGVEGSSVTISAAGNPGYHFSHWNDNIGDSVRVVVIHGDITFTAYFEANVGIGDVQGDGIRVWYNDGCIVIEGNTDNLPIRIYDIAGRIVFCSPHSAPYSPRSPGIYLVKVGMLPAKKVIAIK